MPVDAAAGGPAQLLVHAAGLGDMRLECPHLVVVVDVAAPPRHDDLDSGEVVLTQGAKVRGPVGPLRVADDLVVRRRRRMSIGGHVRPHRGVRRALVHVAPVAARVG